MRYCADCGREIPEPCHGLRRFCSVLCRNRHNAAKAKQRPVAHHGTLVGYVRGCRCADCRGANAAYSNLIRARQPRTQRKVRSDKGIKRKTSIPDEDHGVYSTYKFGCRCDLCRKAANSYNAEWRRRNPELNRAIQTRSQRSNPPAPRAPFDVDALAYAAILDRDPCAYCGRRNLRNNQIDHIDPVSLGADSAWWNLTAACRPCNQRKSNKRLLRFLLYRAA